MMTKNAILAEVFEPNLTNRSSVEASVKMHLRFIQAVSLSLPMLLPSCSLY
jgi:hypothetical protein